MRTILATLHSKFIHASLALPCLAAFVRTGEEECGEIDVREFTVHEPRDQVLALILAEAPDVVAFSVYLWNRRQTLELADALVAAAPGVRVILGGPEVSFDGAELFAAHPGVQALVRGEGEIPLARLLAAWCAGREPFGVPRLIWRAGDGTLHEGPEGPPLADLDRLPSPFELGLVDLSRGCVYYETSRGCPYTCAFCLSALDAQVRSFSLPRIFADLDRLLAAQVPQIKLVDRTFNYDAGRARQIWRHILERNRASRFHFEIGAHLLDEASLDLLAQVPAGMFQFEIGVQSTLPETLAAVDRRAPLARLEENVERLRRAGNIHLHLDLIAGLPGESFRSSLAAIDRVAALRPHHLQLEPVKLIPGSPLRRQAADRQIRFDPHPPYTVLGTPAISFADLQRTAGIGRLLDLTWNSGRLHGFLDGLAPLCGSLAAGLEAMEAHFRRKGLFRHPLAQRTLFEAVWEFVRECFTGQQAAQLTDLLARDCARQERIAPDRAPAFFDTELTPAEVLKVQATMQAEMPALRGKGLKVQHFAAVFAHLPDHPGRTVILFLYLTGTGEGLTVREMVISSADQAPAGTG